MSLLPHSKKESKLDTKSDRGVINEVADLKNCTSVLFFEVGLAGAGWSGWVDEGGVFRTAPRCCSSRWV